MARQQMKSDADRLYEEAESLRDSDSPMGKGKKLKPRADRSAVLSIRIPMSQLAVLRDIARREGKTMSALIQDAVDSLIAEGGPVISYSDVNSIAIAAGSLETARSESSAQTYEPELQVFQGP